MTQPSKPRESSLTFEELRFATIMNPSVSSDIHPALASMDVAQVAQILADNILRVDQLAAAMGIDLAAAIRKRLDPATGRLIYPGNQLNPRKPGDLPNDVERKRSGT